jgi:DNA-binding response OmpR family regulator
VLVVEDDADLNQLICELLSSAGYSPEPVLEGEQAIRSVQAGTPDAIILDVMLPGLDGFDVCRKLKFHRETNRVPTLMLTALDKDASRRHALRVGADRYITKPFDPDVLLAQLREAIEFGKRMEAGHTRAVVAFQMQSDCRMFQQLNEMLGELFVQTNLPEMEIDLVRQAVLEMIENAREWGNRGQADKTVSVSYELTDEALKFIITDEGQGFDPKHIPHAASDDDQMAHLELREKMGIRLGGFGIMLAKGIMNEMSYNERGNQVTLIKKLKPAAT